MGRVADSEPLFHGERILAERHPQKLIRGLAALSMLTGVRRSLMAVRSDWTVALDLLRRMTKGTPIDVVAVSPSYPRDAASICCDIATVQGNTVSQAGLQRPGLFSAQTLCDIAAAVDGHPLPRRTLSVVGAVRNPSIVQAPVGTSVSDLVAACGGSADPGCVVFHNGVLAGERVGDDHPIDLDSTGVVVLPRTHGLVVGATTPLGDHLRRATSACVGCRICTDVCPVALCGGDLKPHVLLQRLASAGGFATTGGEATAALRSMSCTRCGLCTVVCPSSLDPARIVGATADRLKDSGVEYIAENVWVPADDRAGRLLSMPRIEAMLGLAIYGMADWSGPPRAVVPEKIAVALDSPIGRRRPAVHHGQSVGVGDRILLADPASTGVDLRSQVSGRVVEIDYDESLTIQVS